MFDSRSCEGVYKYRRVSLIISQYVSHVQNKVTNGKLIIWNHSKRLFLLKIYYPKFYLFISLVSKI